MSIIVQNESDVKNLYFEPSSTWKNSFEGTIQDRDLFISNDLTSELSLDGIGGTYILKDKKSIPFAVFKPRDEEPGCMNNPKQHQHTKKQGVCPGDGAIREYIAYLLDHDHFAKIPKTTIKQLNLNGTKKNRISSAIYS